MFKTKDPHLFTNTCTLIKGPDKIGSFYSQYHVVSYDDVQLNGAASVDKSKNRKFMVTCTQWINVYNKAGLAISPDPTADPNSYSNYPVMVNSNVNFKNVPGLTIQLLDYSPQTLNTKVQSSSTSGLAAEDTKSTTLTNTVGSVLSGTNSFNSNITVGTTDTLSESFDGSITYSGDTSKTTSSDMSSRRSNDTSSSSAMSIKDWGAYALVNPNNKNPSWTFGQEYPWDAIDCRKSNGVVNPGNSNQIQVNIPASMAMRLYDGQTLYPPSQLSLFGFSFVMKALWLVTLDNNAEDEVTLDHAINYFSGSHAVTGTGPAATASAYMDQLPAVLGVDTNESLSSTIDLPLMALDTLGWEGKPAIIGFIPRRFVVLPNPATGTSDATLFKIISSANNLLVEDTTQYPSPCDPGAGFTSYETYLAANFSPNCLVLQMTVYFKVIDTANYYTLYLKHWKTDVTGVKLTLVINNDANMTITKYVDSIEAEGGENNLLSIVLRDLDYSSVDYHDYLQLGLNSIQITIEPIGGVYVAGCGYQLRAISVEKS